MSDALFPIKEKYIVKTGEDGTNTAYPVVSNFLPSDDYWDSVDFDMPSEPSEGFWDSWDETPSPDSYFTYSKDSMGVDDGVNITGLSDEGMEADYIVIPKGKVILNVGLFDKNSACTRLLIPSYYSEYSTSLLHLSNSNIRYLKIEILDYFSSSSTSSYLNITSLEGLYIPDGAEHIGTNLMTGCTSLKYLRLPQTSIIIDYFALEGCGLKNFKYTGEGITLKYYCFAKTNFENMYLSNATIDTDARCCFSNGECPNLKNVWLDGASSGWEQASELFYNASTLEHIKLPDSLTSIEIGSNFSGCTNLKELILPETVTDVRINNSLMSTTYYYIPSGANVLVQDNENQFWLWQLSWSGGGENNIIVNPQNTALWGKLEDIQEQYPDVDCMTPFTKGIMSWNTTPSFYIKGQYDEIFLTETLDGSDSDYSPRAYGFTDYGKTLETIYFMPDYIKSINLRGDYDYPVANSSTDYCSKFQNDTCKKIVLGEPFYQYYLFDDNSSGDSSETEAYELGYYLLGRYAYYMSNLESFELADGKEQISYTNNGNSEFISTEKHSLYGYYGGSNTYDDAGMYLYAIPQNLQAMDYIIEKIDGGDASMIIGSYAAYKNKNIENITVSDTVESIKINYRAFSQMETLKTFIVNDGICELGDCAFGDDEKLENFSAICSGEVGNYCFSDCINLNTVDLGDQLTSIGNYAFYRCESLKSITVPSSVTSIGNGVFMNCTGLSSIVIPDSVVSMGMSVFSGCVNLTNVTISSNITLINYGMFSDCTGLTSVTIPNGVIRIGDRVFYGCTGLTSIVISDSVAEIGNYAFYGCTSLTSISIPDSITSINKKAFYNCTNLTSITIDRAEDSISGAPWGATNAIVNWTGTT